MSFSVPASLEARLDELVTHYPVKRSASLMFLHALQEHFGYVSREAVEWTAAKLGLQPINVYELVTFYPMFRQEPLGTTHVKVCRTLSCALAGSAEVRELFCKKLGLDAHAHVPQKILSEGSKLAGAGKGSAAAVKGSGNTAAR